MAILRGYHTQMRNLRAKCACEPAAHVCIYSIDITRVCVIMCTYPNNIGETIMGKAELQRLIQDRKQADRVKELVTQLIDETNSLNRDALVAEAVFDAVRCSHRTLQQSFWRIMFDVAGKYKDIQHDGRNESAVKACGKVTEALKDSHLPFV